MHDMQTRVGSPTLHSTIGFTISVFIAIIVMAIVFKVEVVATGLGKVVPISRVQLVQPEFGGQVMSIHVRNGDTVASGDVLIELNQTDAIAELETLTAEMDRLRIEGARLGRMLDALGSEDNDLVTMTFNPPAGLESHPYFHEQSRLLRAEYQDFRAALAQIQTRRETNRSSIAVSEATAARVEAAIETRRERMVTTQRLMEQGTTARSTWLEMLEGFGNLENEREIVLREIDTKLSQDGALSAEMVALTAGLRNRLLQRLNEIEGRSATLLAQRAAASRRVTGSVLRAPVDGIVDRLGVFTIGGVVQAGQEVLRIVPLDGLVEIEAMFSNADIGFLTISQKANIRLDAFPSERFGFVKGVVQDISADSVEMGEANFVYIVRAAPDEAALNVEDVAHPLRPGMTLTMDVITDERRIISYFFAPIIEVIERSLGER